MPYLLQEDLIQQPQNVPTFKDAYPQLREEINTVLRKYCVWTSAEVDSEKTKVMNYFSSQADYDTCVIELQALPSYAQMKTYFSQNNIIVTKYPPRWVDSIPR